MLLKVKSRESGRSTRQWKIRATPKLSKRANGNARSSPYTDLVFWYKSKWLKRNMTGICTKKAEKVNCASAAQIGEIGCWLKKDWVFYGLKKSSQPVITAKSGHYNHSNGNGKQCSEGSSVECVVEGIPLLRMPIFWQNTVDDSKSQPESANEKTSGWWLLQG